MTALVVDDSRAMRMMLRRMLAGIGYEVLEAGNGAEALDVLGNREKDVSLMLVDWNMPEMNGLELVKRVRAGGGHSSPTILMVTTETEIDEMALALEAGADEYLMKPFSRELLEDKLRMLGVVA